MLICFVFTPCLSHNIIILLLQNNIYSYSINLAGIPLLNKDSSENYLLNLRASANFIQPLPPQSQNMWDSIQLPPAWERRYHKEKSKYYYVNHDQKTTQWNHPLDLTREKSNKSE